MMAGLVGLLALPVHAAGPQAAEDDIEALMKQAAEDDAKMAAQAAAPAGKSAAGEGGGLEGYAQFELARVNSSPAHWSKMLTRLEFGDHGKSGTGFKWKWSLRADYDGVFNATNFYNQDVKRDQQFNLSVRDLYADFSLGNWDMRVGRQQVVWGEMVGLFFADVVSAREMREFILPEFNILRIPQWAVRAEYFGDDFHGELLWIPVPTYDETGKPGSDYFPYQVPGLVATNYLNEIKPARKLSNGNFGVRGGWLVGGWDFSAFYYRSMDAAPTFYRDESLAPGTFTYQARHDRIWQYGGTLAKDFGTVVLKGEVVATRGRGQTVTALNYSDGLARQNTVDWALSLDIPFENETRLNLQAFQSIVTNHDPNIIPEKYESGYSVLINGKPAPRFEAEVLWIASLDRNDWLARPKVIWNFEKNWRLVLGADVFHGPPTGLFGRFANRDRLYSEIKYSF